MGIQFYGVESYNYKVKDIQYRGDYKSIEDKNLMPKLLTRRSICKYYEFMDRNY